MALSDTPRSFSYNLLGSDNRTHAFFQPPNTPGFGDTPYASATYSSNARKRPRFTPSAGRYSEASAYTSGTESYSDYLGGPSPAPLANEDYALAGGFDTPGLAASSERLGYYDTGDMRHVRGGWDDTAGEHAAQGCFNGADGPLARERNGKGRSTNTVESPGLGSLLLGLVGGVAGKMWDICLNSVPFRGFYAGGGPGYALHNTDLPYIHEPYPHASTPLPGQYPHDDFLGDFEQDASPVRPSKRLHTSTGSSWVLVDRPETQDTSHRLSARKTSATLTAPLSPQPSASRASNRRSLIPVSRRSLAASATGSPEPARSSPQAHTRRASLAPTRSPTTHICTHSRANSRNSLGGSSSGSPLKRSSPLQRRDKDVVGTDKSMKKMSRQVQDLIREGQAALGTRVEIEEDASGLRAVDEGYGGWCSGEEDVDVDVGGWEEIGVKGRRY